jgi:hypothetical protein
MGRHKVAEEPLGCQGADVGTRRRGVAGALAVRVGSRAQDRGDQRGNPSMTWSRVGGRGGVLFIYSGNYG